MKNIVILGSGGFAREVAWLLEENNKIKQEWNILGFISSDTNDSLLSYPIVGDDDWLLAYKDEIYAVCAVGDPKIRAKIVEKYKNKHNVFFPAIISHYARISEKVKLGRGCIICAGCILTVDITIGDFCICNLNCTLGHDDKIGNFVTISPGSNISGCVEIGDFSDIGTGTAIIPNANIGSNVIIGAGSVVIKNIPSDSTAVGVPAKVIKKQDV